MALSTLLFQNGDLQKDTMKFFTIIFEVKFSVKKSEKIPSYEYSSGTSTYIQNFKSFGSN